MATIDDKVVAMSFESKKFEEGVSKTISALDKLKSALHFPNAGKGLENINTQLKKVDLSHISKGVDAIQHKLGAFSVAALAVFSSLAIKAAQVGIQIAKSLSLDPVTSGFKEYTTNLNSIQTIMSNTASAGTTFEDVTKALKELNRYSDKTIYNFGQMARNIGTFTAAGVDLDTSVNAIKGIANLAAFSGSNAEQASTAMYQLSQAISAGRVAAMDWISVTNAGMGGAVFQRSLAQTAVAMGTLKESALKLEGPMKTVTIAGESFKNSLSDPATDGWLNSKVLTATLAQFTGDLKDADLAAQGFNGAQIAAIQKTAKAANLAATEVKDLGTVFSVAKETAGSGWAQTFEIIFGTFYEAKKTFTDLSNTINGFINANADARNKVLADWKALGGRVVAIQAIKQTFESLMQIIKPIKDAFRDIFPAKTGKDLFNLTMRFEEFSRALAPSAKTVANLKRSFAGFFAIFDIAKQVMTGAIHMFKEAFGAISDGNGGFLEFTGNVGDWLVKVDEALKKSGALEKFFHRLAQAIKVPLKAVKEIGKAIGGMFDGFSAKGAGEQMSAMSKIMGAFRTVIEGFTGAFSKFVHTITGSEVSFQPMIDLLVKSIQDLGPALGKAAANLEFEPILAVIRTGLLTGMFLMFKKFLGKGAFADQLGKEVGKNVSGLGGGILRNISGSFAALQGNLVSMQQNVKSKTLKEIAIAVALLAGSMLVMSLIDPKRLASTLTAMTVAFGDLVGAMALLTVVTKSAGFIKLPFIAVSLIGLAIAIDLLSIAVLALSSLSWEELLKGLGGVAGLLVIISAAAVPLSRNSGGMIQAGIGIAAMGIGLKILASAMKDFAEMSWKEMGKGLTAVAGGLALLTAAMRLMPTVGMVATGVGLIAVGVGLKIIANVVKDFSGMDWKTLGRGMAGLAGSLGAIALAMKLMPVSMVVTAGALVVLAFALKMIVGIIQTLAGMSIKQLARGIIAMGAALGILALGLMAMSGTLAGAAALGIAASSLALFIPVLIALGAQSWTKIIKSLVMLAAALTIIGLAGLLLAPVIAPLLGLGVALVLIGGGLALAGAGMFLFGTGLAALVVALPVGVGVMIAAIEEFQAAIPRMVKNFVIGLVEIVNALAILVPQFVKPIALMLAALVQLIIRATPKILEVFGALITIAAQAIIQNAPKVIAAGIALLIDLLQGIRNNLSKIVTLVSQIIVTFLNALASNIGKIVAAGLNLLVKFIQGISNNIGKVGKAVGDLIIKFISTVASLYGSIVTAGLNLLIKFLSGIANNLRLVIAAGVNIIVTLVKSIGDAGVRIVHAGVEAAGKFVHALADEIPKLAQDVFDAVIELINGMAAVIGSEDNMAKLRSAGMNLGGAIINGMTLGLAGKAAALYAKASEIANHTKDLMTHPWKAFSPSRVMVDLGKNIIDGMAVGLDKNASNAYSSATAVSNGVIGAFKSIFQIASPSKVMIELGKAVSQGFAVGIRGSADDIKQAFADMNEKLTDQMAKSREIIASEQEKLDKLRASKKPDAAAIKEAQKTIKENQDLLARSVAGHILLTKALRDEKQELIGLTKDYEKIGRQLEDAQQKLKELKAEKETFRQGLEDQFAAAPDLSEPMIQEIADARAGIASEVDKLNKLKGAATQDPEAIAAASAAVIEAQAKFDALVAGKVLNAEGTAVDQLATYTQALANQTKAVGAYQATLQQLRKLGLDDVTYQKLLKEGPADQSFANQLLAGGKTAVTALNRLDTQLGKVSKTLAATAAANLKDAGIKSKQGLINGLKQDENKLIAEMENIARVMVKALKRELGIKSPSQVFAELGVLSMEGMAQGFSTGTKIVTDAVTKAANDALMAMKKTMVNISDVVTNELDPNPVITPVLDLTLIKSQAGELGALTNVVPITASTSFGQASRISGAQNAAQTEQLMDFNGPPSLTFEQNNYSPKALTEIEIYRQTKNQLSQLKSVLDIA